MQCFNCQPWHDHKPVGSLTPGQAEQYWLARKEDAWIDPERTPSPSSE